MILSKNLPTPNVLEKSVIAFTCIPDSFLYCVISGFRSEEDRGKGIPKVFSETFERRVIKYQKLLSIKEKRGKIPKRVRDIHFRSPCNATRLALIYVRDFYASEPKFPFIERYS